MTRPLFAGSCLHIAWWASNDVNLPPNRDSKADVLTLALGWSESLYCGQLTLSTQLIKPNYLVMNASGAIIGDGDRKRAPFLVLGLSP